VGGRVVSIEERTPSTLAADAAGTFTGWQPALSWLVLHEALRFAAAHTTPGLPLTGTTAACPSSATTASTSTAPAPLYWLEVTCGHPREISISVHPAAADGAPQPAVPEWLEGPLIKLVRTG